MTDWLHSPIHRFSGANTFFITAATYLKQHFYRLPEALDQLQEILFSQAREHGCFLQAWALLSNHYHLVVRSEDGERVRQMLTRLHTSAAIALNARDGVTGRRVWFQYWDKALTFEASWLARLRYTHENAVHHGIVKEASQYRWCSAKWFREKAPVRFAETVARMKIDRVKVYEP